MAADVSPQSVMAVEDALVLGLQDELTRVHALHPQQLLGDERKRQKKFGNPYKATRQPCA